MEAPTKTDALIRRVHIQAPDDGTEATIRVDGFNIGTGAVAADRLVDYTFRHHLTLWDLAQCLYWPATPDERRHRRNAARIVERAIYGG